ncbi:hypothetical protein WG66_006082 [Moniliophthora roreri]|nr:hypothetical protein WG66_006082 [Moniliophthora roreri]
MTTSIVAEGTQSLLYPPTLQHSYILQHYWTFSSIVIVSIIYAGFLRTNHTFEHKNLRDGDPSPVPVTTYCIPETICPSTTSSLILAWAEEPHDVFFLLHLDVLSLGTDPIRSVSSITSWVLGTSDDRSKLNSNGDDSPETLLTSNVTYMRYVKMLWPHRTSFKILNFNV